ncbi:MAG: ATP-binding protein [Acidobacteriia bacterium]|nr:ATP-binding protein [Terriglobia bacterium]
MLYGREREIKRLVTNLEQGVHTLVFGAAGVGKSILLREAARRLSSNHDASRLAPYVGDCSTRRVLLQNALEALAVDLRASVSAKADPAVERGGYLLRDLRNALIRISCERPICLILDHPRRIRSRMQHLLEMLEEHCTLAFGVTASRDSYDLYYWKFDLMEIRDLPKESALPWIDEELQLMGYHGTLRNSIGNELLRLTGGNPGAISQTLDVIRLERTPLDDPIRVRRMLIEGRIRNIASAMGGEK